MNLLIQPNFYDVKTFYNNTSTKLMNDAVDLDFRELYFAASFMQESASKMQGESAAFLRKVPNSKSCIRRPVVCPNQGDGVMWFEGSEDNPRVSELPSSTREAII